MTIYQTKLRQLEQRMTDFSVEIINTFDKYASSTTLRVPVLQWLRSATSIGANYAEANNASLRTDFRNKIFIAKKEAAETRYWLNVLARVIKDIDLEPLQQEFFELNLILQKTVSTMKNGK
jgi:four helix bundle protein